MEEWDKVLAMMSSTQNEGPNRNQLTQGTVGTKCTTDREKVAPANQIMAAKAKA